MNRFARATSLFVFASLAAPSFVSGCSDGTRADTATSGEAEEAPLDTKETTTPASFAIDSSGARASLAELRARFQVAPDASDIDGVASTPVSFVRAGVASAFVREADGLLPILDAPLRGATTRPARTTLPLRANAAARVVDEDSGMEIAFTLRGASDRAAGVADGLVLYEGGGPEGSDVVQRPDVDGTEDFVVFRSEPAREELVYDVDVRTAAGLRLVGDALELLDADGAPRLRVRPPSLVDASGRVVRASLEVDGCNVDRDPRAPWGRDVTAPGSATCAVRVAWSDVAYPAIVDPGWTSTGNMVVGRCYHTASLLQNGKVLAAGGENTQSTPLSNAELYDPTSGTWAATASMTIARNGHMAATLPNGKVLVAGDQYQGTTAEIYDPSTGKWTATGSMSAARWQGVSVLLNTGKVLAMNGGSAGTELYNPATGTWSATGAMSTSRDRGNAALLSDGRVLASGGGSSATAEIYDPTSGKWTPTGSMTSQRRQFPLVLLKNGNVLAVAGYGGGAYLTSSEIFSPSTGAWTLTGSLTDARYSAAASITPGGSVIVSGGEGQSGVLQTTERYDPFTGVWTSAGSIGQHDDHTSTVLANGKILVAGGTNSEYTFVGLPNASVYDPGTAAGGACTLGSACETGFCVDGVCCHTACAGGSSDCQACSIAAGGTIDGTCTPLADGKTCSDGTACTTGDTCKAGACVGTPLPCAPSDPQCATASCDPATGVCTITNAIDGHPCNDNNACTGLDLCEQGVCFGFWANPCDPPDSCHGPGTCDPSNNVCTNPTLPDGTACDDGNACTSGETCTGGVCQGGVGTTCAPPDACHEVATCDPSSGQCVSAAKADGTTCDDGDGCTTGDACTAGVCGGTAVVCSALDDCHAAGACDPSTGVCSNPTAADGTACDDGDACTMSDTCKGGTCTGANLTTCAPSDGCHLAGVCDPSTGQCSNPVATDGASCDDGDACTQGDACTAGVCVPGAAKTCAPPNECLVDGSCDPSDGTCLFAAAPDGTACMGSGSCANGVCVVPSSASSSSSGGASSTSSAGGATTTSSSASIASIASSSSAGGEGGAASSASHASASHSSSSSASGGSSSAGGDASEPTGTTGGGCSCREGEAPADAPFPALFALAAAIAWSRRRARDAA